MIVRIVVTEEGDANGLLPREMAWEHRLPGGGNPDHQAHVLQAAILEAAVVALEGLWPAVQRRGLPELVPLLARVRNALRSPSCRCPDHARDHHD